MAKFILGLDIGTNSIGWVLLRNDKIFDKGVIIFPIGTNVMRRGLRKLKIVLGVLFAGQAEQIFDISLEEKT